MLFYTFQFSIIFLNLYSLICQGCIPPSKIIKMTIIEFVAITDTWNISIYIHIMDINTTAPHL